MMRREKEKLEKTLGGIRDMARIPSAVWVVDTNKEHLAVDEAHKLGIPVVAILDTNCDPDVVDYRIPGNDDAIRSVTLLTRVIADAVADGLRTRAGASDDAAAQEPMAAWEAELLGGELQTGDAGDQGARAAASEGEATAAEQVPAGTEPAAAIDQAEGEASETAPAGDEAPAAEAPVVETAEPAQAEAEAAEATPSA